MIIPGIGGGSYIQGEHKSTKDDLRVVPVRIAEADMPSDNNDVLTLDIIRNLHLSKPWLAVIDVSANPAWKRIIDVIDSVVQAHGGYILNNETSNL